MILILFSIVIQGFKTPESVIFYKGYIYVSNINGSPNRKDGNGYISKLDLKGNFIKEKFAYNLNAPKGIGFIDSVLFVSDIDRVCGFNIRNGQKIYEIKIEGAKFLNDITSDNINTIYVSDNVMNRIYVLKLKNGVLKLAKSYNFPGGPNGLFYSNDKLIVVTWVSGKVFYVDSSFKRKKLLASGFKQLDGVWKTKGGIIFSSWDGNIYEILNNGKRKKLLSNLESPADISYIDSLNIILIPEFLDNKIVIEKLEK